MLSTFNNGEAIFWLLTALVYGVLGLLSTGRQRLRCFIAVPVLAAFGISDFVEAHTGAFWKPWWLFAWKAACVLALLLLVVDYLRARRTPPV